MTRGSFWAGLAAVVALATACAGSVGSPAPAASASGSSPTVSIATSTVAPAPAGSSSPVPATSPSGALIPLFGPMPTAPLDGATSARLQAAVDDIGRSAPDVIAAVISPNGTWAGAAGFDGPNDRKAQPTDEFAIASVTKTITAALALKLADEGKLDLDAPIAKYLTASGHDGNGATVLQVIGMESGMGDTTDATFQRIYAHCEKPFTEKELLTTFGEPVGPAGTYHYSNPSYKLLGFAIEAVTGQPMDVAFRSVLDPAGGARMMIQTAKAGPPKPWALPVAGHNGEIALEDFGVGGGLPCLAYATGSLSAAGVASDAPSLARWAWALANGEIVSHERLAMMAGGYGLDEMPELAPGAYGHGGTQPGYASVMALLSRERSVVVLFENDGDADVSGSAGKIVRALDG